MRFKICLCGLFVCVSIICSGQNFNKTDFYEADMELLSGEYAKAQKIYDRLIKSEPENANLNFLNGLCIINIPGRKKESLYYLEKASPYASSNYKYGSSKEINAPLEVLKYCAIANKLNNNIPRAIELLNQYITLLKNDQKEIDVATTLLQSCYTTQKMQEHPVYFSKTELGSSLISDLSKQFPVVNHDETMLFFSVRGRYEKDDIYFSEKVNGIWSVPVKITTYLGIKEECIPSSVSFDNERVYLTVGSGVTSDIYYSFRKNNRWQKITMLDKPVNGKSGDADAFESSDGKYLYFSSDRKGGSGAFDIYRAEKDEKGNWGKEINLGNTINTDKNDRWPIMDKDDTKLFFKSEGHENLGGYDIFYSLKTGDNAWSVPVNIGYPLNTSDDDINYMPVGDGKFAYIAMSDPAFNGSNNLYYIELLDSDPFKKYEISGQIAFNDGSYDFTNSKIEIITTDSYEKVFDIVPDEISGKFNFELGTGKYMLNFIKPDYNIYTHLVDFSSGYSEDTYYVYPFLEKTIPDVVEPPVVVAEVIEETPAEEAAVVYQEPVSEIVEVPATETVVEYVPEQPATYDYVSNTGQDYSGEEKYTIQLMASIQNVIPDNLNNSLSIEIQKGNDAYYRYITGIYSSLRDAEDAKREITKSKYKDAFIRYYNLEDYLNKPIRPIAYTIQVMALDREVETSTFRELEAVKVSYGDDQIYRYTTGVFASLESARNELQIVIDKGYKSAFILATSKISNY